MRFQSVAATVVALSLIACSGPKGSASRMDTEEPASGMGTVEPASGIGTEESASGTGTENTLIETPEYTGVIISENGASEFSYLFDTASTSFWEPSIDDVARAEERIRQFLVSAQQDPKLDTYQKENAALILRDLETYRRQYVGIVVDGEKRIWCNSFLSHDSFPDWLRLPVDVDDGGTSFWQIEYDLLKDECINFYVHGEA